MRRANKHLEMWGFETGTRCINGGKIRKMQTSGETGYLGVLKK